MWIQLNGPLIKSVECFAAAGPGGHVTHVGNCFLFDWAYLYAQAVKALLRSQRLIVEHLAQNIKNGCGEFPDPDKFITSPAIL